LLISISIYTAFLWWFFFSKKAWARAETVGEGAQELEITVKGGYSPDTIVVRKDTPVRLKFTRKETSDCSERVIFADFKVSKKLPANETTVVDSSPIAPENFPLLAVWECTRAN
jgi:Cu+-exporting ATPase